MNGPGLSLRLIYQKEAILEELEINGITNFFKVDNVHYTKKCQIVGKYDAALTMPQTKLFITCPYSNAEIIYTLSDDEGVVAVTNVTDQLEITHFNGAYEYKPRYYFAVDESFDIDFFSVAEVFGDKADKCVVKQVVGYNMEVEVDTIGVGSGPTLVDPDHIPSQVPTKKVYIVEPLWDNANNQYFEFVVDFRNVQHQDPCVISGVQTKKEICCDILDSQYEAPGECKVCNEAACAGDGEVPEITPVCLYDNTSTAINVYTGPTNTEINGVSYPLVEHDESECEYLEIIPDESGGLYAHFVIDTAGLSEDDYNKFKWNITDYNNVIIQSWSFGDSIPTPTVLENVEGLGDIERAIAIKVPINTNRSCILLNLIGASSKIWRQSYFILGKSFGTPGIEGDQILAKYLRGGSVGKGSANSTLIQLAGESCSYGCNFSTPKQFVTERCSKTILEAVDGFTDFKVEVATSGTSQTYEFASFRIYEIYSGNTLVEFTDLEPNSIYEKNIRFGNDFNLGIEVMNNVNRGPIRYKIVSEDGTVVINKTIK